MIAGATIDREVEQLDEAEAIGAAFTAGRLALLRAAVELCPKAGWRRSGARTLAMWLSSYTDIERPEARRMARLAELCHRQPALADAVLDGRISYGRAELLAGHAAGLREPYLADSLPSLLRENERLTRFDDWVSLLAHWCSVVDQELDLPLKEFRTEIHLSQSLFGQGEIHGWLDPETLAIVDAGLDAFTPAPDPLDGPLPPRSLAQRKHQALADMARWGLAGFEPEEMRDGDDPEHAADAPPRPTRSAGDRRRPADGPAPLVRPRSGVTANVTIDLRTFAGDRRFDDLDGFDVRSDRWSLTQSAVERLVCDAGLVATLLDGRRTVLAATDRSEQFTAAQRRAIAARDGDHCGFPDCDRPGKHCQAHHLRPRAEGGVDDITNAVLGCSFHHKLWHQGWTMRFDEPTNRWVAIDPDGIEWHGRGRGSPGG